MKLFGQEVPDKINIENKEINSLRIKLLEEELGELKQALDEQNKAKVLDALVDLFYVLIGTILALGFESVFDKGFKIVQESNLSKTCESLRVAEQNKKYYNENTKHTAGYVLHNYNFIITDIKTGKVLKPLHYIDAAPKLKELVK